MVSGVLLGVANQQKTGKKQETALPRSGTRFAPGQSGNPAGRPKGSRGKASILAQAMVDGDFEAIISKAIECAKAGEPVAMRLCIERLVPPQRGPVVEIALPAIRRAEDVVSGFSAVLAAAAAGEISLGEAKEFMALLDGHRRAIETHELAVRIQLIERDLKEAR